MASISREIEKQVGVLIDRKGVIELVMVGTSDRLEIPEPKRLREDNTRLRGLRLIHTHLDCSPLSKDDLNDLSILRLDAIVALGVTSQGLPSDYYKAHLLPDNTEQKTYEISGPLSCYEEDPFSFIDWINELEEEFTKQTLVGSKVSKENMAILVGVYSSESSSEIDLRLDELDELARSAGLFVVARIIQRRPKPDNRFWIGQGKLEDVLLKALQLGVDILLFDTELNPTQSRNLGEKTNLKILDRSQLILDIFSQRAFSREGKIQVELAQLKYLLPRLHKKNQAMSRLTGGIGGRGPGETKLEINKRLARDRITRLERQLKEVSLQRQTRRNKRNRDEIPIVSVVGYTNAGKSTLINSLTQSDVVSEDLMFSTLEPVSRRMRFPEEREVIFTDTVGFIRELPPELLAAFKATLEELQDASLLVHLVDISDSNMEQQMESVEKILTQLELEKKPRILVFNKTDRLEEDEIESILKKYEGLGVSALDKKSFQPLLFRIERELWNPETIHIVQKSTWSPFPIEN